MRIFLAVDLNAPLRSGIAAIQQNLHRHEIPGIRWTRPEGIHLTLRFCGEVAGATVDRLVRALGPGAPHAPFSVRVGGLGTFPPRGAPRVLFLGVRDTGALQSLAEWVEERVCSAGISPEPRPFHPHLTLARFREGSRKLARELLEPSPASDLGELRVDRIVMFESHLGPEGARYTALQTFPLLGAANP